LGSRWVAGFGSRLAGPLPSGDDLPYSGHCRNRSTCPATRDFAVNGRIAAVHSVDVKWCKLVDLSPLTVLLLERSWSKQVIKIIASKGEILKPNPSLREFLMGSAVVALFSLVGLGQVAKAQARLAFDAPVTTPPSDGGTVVSGVR
jgi:hypothetical protein